MIEAFMGWHETITFNSSEDIANLSNVDFSSTH